MILGIDPKVDFAFKYLLGRDSTRPILIDVLNSVLKPPAGHEIREIELLNPFNLQEAEDDKLSILDIKARDQSGRGINLEMQMLPYPYYDKRIVYYGSRMHQQQLHQGEGYGSLRPTISISFLNHVLFPQVPDHHLCFRLLEERHHFPMSEDIEFHILELPKFTKTLAQLTSGLDVWLYFLRFAEMIDPVAVPAPLRHPAILRAVEGLTMLTQTDIERERYESRRKAQLDHLSAVSAIQAAQSELETSRSKLEASRSELETSRSKLEASRSELETSRSKLEASRGELETSRSELGTSRSELETSRSELETSRSELETSRSELEAARGKLDESLHRGQQIGIIHAFEQVLQRSQTPKEQLLAMSLDGLKRLAEDLSKQVLNRP